MGITCTVCQGLIKIGETGVLQCGHKFDLQCIKVWVSINRFCPECCKDLSEGETAPIPTAPEKTFLTTYMVPILNSEQKEKISNGFKRMINQLNSIQNEKKDLTERYQLLQNRFKNKVESFNDQALCIAKLKAMEKRLLKEKDNQIEENKRINVQLEKIKLEKDELSAKYQKHLEEYLEYRKLTSAYHEQQE